MSKQTLGFIITWTNNTGVDIAVSGISGNGNSNWNDNNGTDQPTLNEWITMAPGQSVTITSNVEDCVNQGHQYVSIATVGDSFDDFAQTFLVWNPQHHGGQAVIQTVDASGTGNYSEAQTQVDIDDHSFSFHWGTCLCELTVDTATLLSEDPEVESDATYCGSCLSGNADANSTVSGNVVINGTAPGDVAVAPTITVYTNS